MNRVPTPDDPIPLGRNGKPVWENEIRSLLRDFRCGMYSMECINYAKANAKPDADGNKLYDLAMHKVRDILDAIL